MHRDSMKNTETIMEPDKVIIIIKDTEKQWFDVSTGVIIHHMYQLHNETSTGKEYRLPEMGLSITLNYLAHHDDIPLFSTTQKGIQEATNRIESTSSKIGLRINTEKTEEMNIRQQNISDIHLRKQNTMIKNSNMSINYNIWV